MNLEAADQRGPIRRPRPGPSQQAVRIGLKARSYVDARLSLRRMARVVKLDALDRARPNGPSGSGLCCSTDHTARQRTSSYDSGVKMYGSQLNPNHLVSFKTETHVFVRLTAAKGKWVNRVGFGSMVWRGSYHRVRGSRGHSLQKRSSR